jgi:stage II sporulation protein D
MLKLFFLTSLIVLSSLQNVWSTPVVSVRIGKSLRNIHVTGLDLQRHLLFNNDFKNYVGKKTVKFNCETFTTLNKQRNKPILLATLESPTGLLSYENVKYQGLFKVITNPKGDSCDIINDIPIESYISSLLTKEMNSKWPIEALKAQAVAARSYALHKMESQQVSKELGNEAFYDLESSEKHQVSGAFFDSTPSTTEAAEATRGEVLLTSEGKLRPIFFHAKCGGKTLRPDQVWHNREASYQSVNCPFCHNIGPKGWTKTISYERMKSFFKWASDQKILQERLYSEFNSIILVPDNIDKFTVNFYINDRPYIIEKGALRRYFGNVIFPSNSFALEIKNSEFAVYGEGLGHNVGLCQMGAFALAKQGWSYKKILSHYFPEHVLRKMY